MDYKNNRIDGWSSLIHPSSMWPPSSQTGFEFLITEVETTSTFVRIASDAGNPEKRLRNVQNARKGYETLLHFMQTLVLTGDQRAELNVRIASLRKQLIGLGEKI